jgi:hypothetical protein
MVIVASLLLMWMVLALDTAVAQEDVNFTIFVDKDYPIMLLSLSWWIWWGLAKCNDQLVVCRTTHWFV